MLLRALPSRGRLGPCPCRPSPQPPPASSLQRASPPSPPPATDPAPLRTLRRRGTPPRASPRAGRAFSTASPSSAWLRNPFLYRNPALPSLLGRPAFPNLRHGALDRRPGPAYHFRCASALRQWPGRGARLVARLCPLTGHLRSLLHLLAGPPSRQSSRAELPRAELRQADSGLHLPALPHPRPSEIHRGLSVLLLSSWATLPPLTSVMEHWMVGPPWQATSTGHLFSFLHILRHPWSAVRSRGRFRPPPYRSQDSLSSFPPHGLHLPQSILRHGSTTFPSFRERSGPVAPPRARQLLFRLPLACSSRNPTFCREISSAPRCQYSQSSLLPGASFSPAGPSRASAALPSF